MITPEQDYCVHSVGNCLVLWPQSECLAILGFPPRVISDGHAHSLTGGGSSSGCGPDFFPHLCFLEFLRLIPHKPCLTSACAHGVWLEMWVLTPAIPGSTWVTWSHSFDFSKILFLFYEMGMILQTHSWLNIMMLKLITCWTVFCPHPREWPWSFWMNYLVTLGIPAWVKESLQLCYRGTSEPAGPPWSRFRCLEWANG